MKISIPTDFGDITLAEYNKMHKVLNSKPTDIVELLSIALRCDKKKLKNATRASLNKAMKEINWMFQKPNVDEMPFVDRFTLKGVEYGFIPNMQKLSVGEFVDIEHFTTKGTYDHLAEIMGILYRPVTEKYGNHYDIEPYDDYDWQADRMLDMPVDIAIAAIVFFYVHERKLTRNLRYSLAKKKARQRFIKSGDGTRSSTT